MTLIVSPEDFQSKDHLKKRLDEGCLVTDPSVLRTWCRSASALPVGFSGDVTNHPKRNKYAEILKTEAGWRVK